MTNARFNFRPALLIAALLLMAAHDATAQSRVGTTAAPFLTLGTGARGQALGHAYTALARGPDALFWNPGAASRRLSSGQLGGAYFTHHDWIAGISYDGAGVVVPAFGSSVLGLSMAVVNYGDMEVRTVASPEGTGATFSAADLSLGLTYSAPLTDAFHFGSTVKYVHQRIRDMRASTIAFDFGFLLVTEYFRGLQVAASISNFGGKMQMDGINSERNIDIDENNTGSSESIPARLRMDRWDLPLSFRFGVAMPVVQTGPVSVMAVADAHQTNDNNLNSDVGAELRYQTRTVTFDARAGYRDGFLDNVDSHLSLGTGIEVQVAQVRFGFDFAYVPHDLLDDVRMFDFRIHF
ncbi:MAG: PorV/PorQ family protein [Rhodothermales bacterium]|nr:PorV/PorQ family protein [Rhodothermales bacterium]MBO6780013.1 PorV/PorQ family protein [Rhodothermales bacterium]